MVGFAVIPLLFMTLVAVALVSVVVRSCTLPRGMVPAPVCGRCRYPAAGGERCPECGGAYGEVGLLTPELAMRSRPGLVSAGVCLAVLCLFLAGFVLMVAQPIVSSTSLQRDTLWAEYQPASTPISFSAVVVASRDRWASGRVVDGEARLTVMKPGTATGPNVPLPAGPVLVVGAGQGQMRLLDRSGAEVLRAPAGDAEAVRRLFELSGVEAGSTALDGSRVQAVAALTIGILDQQWPGLGNPARPAAPAGLMQRSMNSGSSPRAASLAGVVAPRVVAGAVGLIVFALVLRWVARRRSRLLTPPASPSARSA